MNINNSIQKTMQSTQMDYEISSPPLHPYNIHYIQALHSFCCRLLKPEWKLLVVWLGWSLTLLLLYPVLVLVPHAPGPGPGPGQWTPPSLLLVTPGGAPLVTGHSMCCVPVCCWWCCSVQWGCCWLTRGCCPRTASPPQPPLPVQPPPSPHLSIHPSTAAKNQHKYYLGPNFPWSFPQADIKPP